MARGGSEAAQAIEEQPHLPHQSAVESWALTLAAVEDWFRTAKQGDTLIYAHGPTLIRGAASQRLGLLGRAGEVILHNPKRGNVFDFIAIRNRVRMVRELPAKPREAIDPLMRETLTLIEAAARQGRRCQSDEDLGRSLGVTANSAKWQLRKLASAGIIRTRLVPAPGEPKFRIITILASGLETAGPEVAR